MKILQNCNVKICGLGNLNLEEDTKIFRQKNSLKEKLRLQHEEQQKAYNNRYFDPFYMQVNIKAKPGSVSSNGNISLDPNDMTFTPKNKK